jgi:hypothetical protein
MLLRPEEQRTTLLGAKLLGFSVSKGLTEDPRTRARQNSTGVAKPSTLAHAQ